MDHGIVSCMIKHLILFGPGLFSPSYLVYMIERQRLCEQGTTSGVLYSDYKYTRTKSSNSFCDVLYFLVIQETLRVLRTRYVVFQEVPRCVWNKGCFFRMGICTNVMIHVNLLRLINLLLSRLSIGVLFDINL